MKKYLGATIAIAALLFASSCLSQSDHDAAPNWLTGTWEKTIDEDGSPPDKITFRDDGTWVSYGPDDQQRISPYHLEDGDIYLTVEMHGKGPVALVFRPSSDRTKLIFTSPRTINNSTYERVDRGVSR